MFYVYIGVTMWYLILYIVSSLAWPDQQESFPLATFPATADSCAALTCPSPVQSLLQHLHMCKDDCVGDNAPRDAFTYIQ